jgi:hypothetical protein
LALAGRLYAPPPLVLPPLPPAGAVAVSGQEEAEAEEPVARTVARHQLQVKSIVARVVAVPVMRAVQTQAQAVAQAL